MEYQEYERQLQEEGYALVCGCDEVGRGPLAGPVVCAAVIMPNDRIEGVTDSKKLSAKKREQLDVLIREKAIAYAICRVEAQVIDEINILQATRRCMKEAVEQLNIPPDFVLTDGNMTLDIQPPQRSIVKGDLKCYTIGCASIIAKVYRDRLMDEYAEEYPYYDLQKNKGYGTAKHIQGIVEHGLCPIHRRSFTKKWSTEN